MRTDYALHEKAYRKRKATGQAGWDTAETIRENLEVYRRMMREHGLQPRGSLLELGCGAGDLALGMAKDGFDVQGVDISPTAIEWACEKALARGLAVQFHVGDVLTLADFPDARYDVVMDGHCFHCIIGPDRAKFLAAARRVLKPGGVLIIASMCDGPVSAALRARFDPRTRCEVHDGVAYRYLGLADAIVGEVVAAGFRVRSSERRPPRHADDEADLLIVADKGL